MFIEEIQFLSYSITCIRKVISDMAIRILAVDMDGTCLNFSNRIDPETIVAMYQAENASIHIVPTTGRSLSCLPHQLKPLTDLFRYVISSNGAVITDMHTGKDIYNALLDHTTAASIIHKSRCPGLAVAAHIDHQYYVQGLPVKLVGNFVYGKDSRQSIVVKDLRKTVLGHGSDVEELQFFFLNKEARLKTTKALLSFPQVYAPLDQRYVEIFSKDAGKGKAFAFLQDYLSIDKCESACIGDGENDIHMFHHTGLKFAMGNGHPTLKKQADIVVKDNDHGGVVQALHILLHTHHAL